MGQGRLRSLRRHNGLFLSWAWLNSMGGDLESSWIVAVVATAGDAGVEDVAATVDRRGQFGMDN